METDQVLFTSLIGLAFGLVQFLLTWYFKRSVQKIEEKRQLEQKRKDDDQLKREEQQRAKDQHQVTIARGVKALLQSEIHREAEKLIKRDHATGDEKRRLESLFNSYRDLGGNGATLSVFEEVMKLQNLKKERED